MDQRFMIGYSNSCINIIFELARKRFDRVRGTFVRFDRDRQKSTGDLTIG
ncbi:hypothetical protein OROGR_027090 [Orobanche gracilis]